jgi:hypothetical protein
MCLFGVRADAAVTHEFLPGPSEELTKGVPVGCGTKPPEKEPPCISGALSGVTTSTGDSGHLWVAERMEETGNSRVDEFDASSGAFSRQLHEEAGVFDLDHGVAVGHPEGEEEVYVGAAQSGTGNVVAVFGPSGKLQHAWTGANTPNKAFVHEITGVAVDTSANLKTHGAVYVAEAGGVVDVFKPKAGGEEPGAKEPKEEVAQIKLPETPCVFGEPRCENPLTHEACKEGEAGCVILSAPFGLAVSGASGDVVVAYTEGVSRDVVDVYEPSAFGVYTLLFKIVEAPQGVFHSFPGPGSVAVDPGTGNIYVLETQLMVMDEFGPEGKYLGRLKGIPSGAFHNPKSVAVDPLSHRVFVGDYNSETNRGSIDAYDKDLVIPDVETLAATDVSPEGARLNGNVKLDKEGNATCRFAWGTTTELGNFAPCEPAEVTSEESAVHAHIGELQPDTTYYYRLQATNKNGTNTGEEAQAVCEGKPSVDACFTTEGPGLGDQWASGVSSSSATLNAKVNPHGKPTQVFFEYGPSTGYGKTAPVPPTPIGSGEEPVLAEGHVQALEPSTLYHYRAVAVDELGEFHGSDHTFTTQGAGGGLVLPDGRQWEQVSPPDKHGANLLPIEEAGLVQSSASGAAITYLGNLPTEEHAPGFFDVVQIFSARGVGWSSQDISLPHVGATGASVGFGHEYRFFSNDFSRALVEPQGEFTSLKPEVFPPDTERTPYVRHDSTCAATPGTCFQPLVLGCLPEQACPPTVKENADVPEGARFGGSEQVQGNVRFVGGTPDLAHVIVRASVALTSTPTGNSEQLYEWSAGRPPAEELQLVSFLPGKEGPAAGAHLGSGNNSARHAVSDDGSRIVWSETGEHPHLYMRVNVTQPRSPLGPKGECTVLADACTIQLDAVQGGSGAEPVNPQFQVASRDGSRVFFTDTQRLTKGSGALSGKPDLYECEVVEVAGELQCRLSDLTPPTSGEAADVRGTVLGASEDGSWVYFVANGVLGEGAKHGAVPGNCAESVGTCTLYVWHGGATMPIAVLSGEDNRDWGQGQGGEAGLPNLTARVSPGGGWLAFMSDRSLTGYDNRDARSSQPDEEVFVYHAQASGSGQLEPGRLVCASCNPSGARPVGVEYRKLNGGLVGGFGVWSVETWIAANVPGWTPYKQKGALYQSRYLSDEGRLFFNSSDALVPQDINNNEDVYEYEPVGVGGCSPTSPTFSERSGGCVALVSSGRAAGESGFLDASENGNDVFFLTGERLVLQDVDTALDVYDAHVCSAAVPCLSSSTSPPSCATADACRAAPAPQPQVFGSPASSTFSGAGNLASTPSKPGLPPKKCKKRVRHACKKMHRAKRGSVRKHRVRIVRRRS